MVCFSVKNVNQVLFVCVIVMHENYMYIPKIEATASTAFSVDNAPLDFSATTILETTGDG